MVEMVESSLYSESLSRKVEDNLSKVRGEVRHFLVDSVKSGLIHYTRLANSGFVQKFGWKFKVGYHEAGHEIAARAEKATVFETSVETPEAEGIMKFSLGARPLLSALKSMTIIAQGSRAAEQIMNDADHSGCAGDDAQTMGAAAGLARFGRGSVGVLFDSALQSAKGLAGMTQENLKSMSYSLLRKQVIRGEDAYAVPGYAQTMRSNVIAFPQPTPICPTNQALAVAA